MRRAEKPGETETGSSPGESAGIPGTRSRPESGPRASPTEAALYIGDLCGELALLARRSGLDMLAYLLEMARLEAETAARRTGRGLPWR